MQELDVFMGIDRIKTGIPGFDAKISGGLEAGSVLLLSGGPGSGKTLFGLQFLYQGLLDGENGLYVSSEESQKDIVRDMENIGLNAKKHIDNNKLKIEFFAPLNFEYLPIIEIVKNYDIKRLVMDSLSSLVTYFKDESQFRKFVLEFTHAMKDLGITTVMISEEDENTPEAFKMYSGQFLADSLIKLLYSGLGGEYDRSMQIVKMRRTNHIRELIPLKIDSKGLSVK